MRRPRIPGAHADELQAVARDAWPGIAGVALTAGLKLGPYEILGPLGAGGMGEVHRARDLRLGREVALKVLPVALAGEPERLTRLRREAQTLAALNHPNIAAIYALEEVDGAPCLVLELVAGETLAARIARGAMPLREALPVVIQIAAAIEAAHESGIVHRDLKPGNVMITPMGAVKVLDFGLARFEPRTEEPTSRTQSPTVTGVLASVDIGAIAGTAAYMSPEQVRGRPVDRRSDLWSFGCVLFECLAGMPAFSGETTSDLFAKILEREPDWTRLAAGTPTAVREIVRRCLRKDADSRPRDIRDVRLELEQIQGSGGRAGTGAERSIAVLPFENLSGQDDEFFADGVTDEILSALAQVEGLRVAARTSCFAFKGKREDLRTVGERLDVDTVLEGSVRRSGSKLRITAQLVNVSDGYQLWSERYDREMTDVFEVQETIAKAIAIRLRGALYAEQDRVRLRRSTANLEAYELLLKGRALQRKRGRFLDAAVSCFERAIALDPQCAEAMSCLADSYRLMGVFGGAATRAVMPRAKALATQALAIDPHLAEAWGVLATVVEQYEWNFTEASVLWERALALDPRSAYTRSQRALWALFRGEYDGDRAAAESRRAVDDDPLNAWVMSMHSYVLGLAGRHAESIAVAEKSVELDPESFFPHWNVLRGYAWAGRYDEAIARAPALLRDSGRAQWVLGALAWSYGESGAIDRARAVYDEIEGRSRHEFVSPFWLATCAAAARLNDEALRGVQRCIAERELLVLWSRISPFWERVRGLPGYADIIREVWS